MTVRVSELIEVLQQAYQRYGDGSVVVEDAYSGWRVDVLSAELAVAMAGVALRVDAGWDE